MRPQYIGLLVTCVLAAPMSVSAQQGPGPRRLPPIEPSAAEPAATALGPAAPTFAASAPSATTAPAPEAEPAGEDTAALEAELLEEMQQQQTWYDWLVPSYWSLPPDWESSFELGIDGSEGNAKTLTFRSGVDLRRKVDWSDLTVALDYVKSTADTVETKHNAQLEANHDWLLGESPWSVFAKSILVYDEFRPFDLELTLNSGFGYQFVDNDVWSFKGRLGSGATRQWDGPVDRWRPEAMLGVDFNYRISDRQKLRVKSEYFPEWGDWDVYRIRTDAGWEMLLDDATNMSLKLGIIDRYDSNAGGTNPNALDYSLLLLWKL